ncbi:MAG TPA: NADH-quinone oxidoreductase subunit M [bacterium]|jgi:NADH-quinone oxidoreductase subunit M|nr:NADH-quinone oxidoreductase subunit M [bacterium]
MLSLIIGSSLLSALVVAFGPWGSPGAVRRVSLGLSLVQIGIVVWVLSQMDSSAGFQMQEQVAWIPALGSSYHLGIDGISRWLVALNALLLPISILASWNAVQKNVRAFHALLLALQAMVYGVFLSLDVFLFYLFWEASLLPMYFLIGVWGGERRLYATIKFVLYTLSGSLLMLLAMIWMAFLARKQLGHLSFDLVDWKSLAIGVDVQRWLFLAFFLAFAIKVPLFPFHTWLPDAHVEAPTAGSILLAGVLLKLGTYGLMRFNINLFPEAALLFQRPVLLLCLIGTIYGAVMVLVQTDFKKMVAYSSVSHMGLCVLGLFSFTLAGQQGALLTMLNHGISTGALFLVVGIFYERCHTRDLSQYGGAIAKMPVLGLLFLPVVFSSMGVPGTNGFVNEFLCLRGAFLANPLLGAAAALTLILGAAYMLRLTQKVMYGPVASHAMEELTDINARERTSLGVFVALIFVLGVFPNLVLSSTEASVQMGLDRLLQGQPAAAPAVAPPVVQGSLPSAPRAKLAETKGKGSEVLAFSDLNGAEVKP